MWREEGAADSSTSLPGCLSVSSASLPPYTLSHFSPMSLPEQGGGDIKKTERREKERERGTKRRKDRLRTGRKRGKIPERMMATMMMRTLMLEEGLELSRIQLFCLFLSHNLLSGNSFVSLSHKHTILSICTVTQAVKHKVPM